MLEVGESSCYFLSIVGNLQATDSGCCGLLLVRLVGKREVIAVKKESKCWLRPEQKGPFKTC